MKSKEYASFGDQCRAQPIKLPFGIPHHDWIEFPRLPLVIQLPANVSGKAADDNLCAVGPGTHMGDPNGICGFWFSPIICPVLAGIWGVKPPLISHCALCVCLTLFHVSG